jgi:peptidoglycan hydrolase FlgJ
MTSLGIDPRFITPGTPDVSSAATAATSTTHARAREQAEDFEAMFLSNMFQNMFTGMDGEGPMGGTTGVAPWRSFLTQEYGKMFAKSGGIGLADDVYRSLIAQQEARAA